MVDALLRECSYPNCTALVRSGRCEVHRRAADARRQPSSVRGYGAPWRRWCRWFDRQLIAHDVTPVCGAALPGGPSMHASQCKAAGILTPGHPGAALHHDHEPPLAPSERTSRRSVCDPRRVGLLCQSCHSAKTRREQAEGRV